MLHCLYTSQTTKTPTYHNDTQIEQTLTMHDLADMTEQRTYDSMLAAVPIYHGNNNEDFDEWADQLEALCEISQ